MITAEYSKDTREFEEFSYAYDIVVVGAGPAGICAAIAAAREGRQVALITDRPVLGGSASSEVRVGPGSAANTPWNRWAKETGIWEELNDNIKKRAATAGKWRWFHYDEAFFDAVRQEENISLYINTSIFKAEKNDHKICKVTGVQLRSEKIMHFSAAIFIDCSGDGVLAYLSGASYRVGREAKSEFHETYAPAVADRKTMGATLLFTTVDAKHEVKYTPPDWAIDLRELPSIIDPVKSINRGIGKMPDGTFYGFWWVEYGGDIDSIKDDQDVITHLRAVVYGVWDYVKNSGKFDSVSSQDMNWIGYLPGKRESRRIVGPHICTEHDFMNQRSFADRIGFTGWSLDIHPPKGYLDNEPGCRHQFLPGIADVPYRALYSVDVPNLMMAGRDVSCTHIALGTLRLICTGAMMGQAAGTAASMCISNRCLPEDIYHRHMEDLQNTLCRRDQSLLGHVLIEDSDYSRSASVTASSERVLEQLDVDQWLVMDRRYGQVLPVETDRLESVRIFLMANKDTEVSMDVIISDKIQNYRYAKIAKTITSKVPKGKNWIRFHVDQEPGEGKKLILMFRKNVDVFVGYALRDMVGAFVVLNAGDSVEYEDRYQSPKEDPGRQFAFKTEPVQKVYSVHNVNDGHVRPLGLPHLWSSAKMENNTPEWLEYELEGEKEISSVEIVFNSDLNRPNVSTTVNSVYPGLVQDYRVMCQVKGEWVTVVNEVDNYKRFRVHRFDKVPASKVKLEIYRTHGLEHAEVFDMRIYP